MDETEKRDFHDRIKELETVVGIGHADFGLLQTVKEMNGIVRGLEKRIYMIVGAIMLAGAIVDHFWK